MSGSKKIKSQRSNDNELTRNRNSFDRFGDDLCEIILKYLWFADKIKFECVSKQWKRLIFCRQNVLEICVDLSFNGLMAKRLLSFNEEKSVELKNFSVIECVLKKCPNIRCVKIDRKVDQMTDQFWHIIADNCHNLTSIKFDIVMSTEAMKYFGEKRGKTLTSIDNSGHDYSLLFNYCPNLMSVSNHSLSQLMCANITFPKLREIKNFNIDDRNVDLMHSFVSSYVNTIKVLEAFYSPTNINYKAFMAHISELPNIERLQLFMFIHDFEDIDILRFAESINKIGINCVRVKSLILSIFSIHCNVTMNTLLYAIKSFTKLNYLNLYLKNMDENVETVDQSISIKMLSQCTNLKKIFIDGAFSDTFFANVEQYLPQLSFVYIITNKCISDETIKNLAKLKNLRTLFIETVYRMISIKILSKGNYLKKFTIFGSISDTFFANIEHFLPQLSFVKVITNKWISDKTINNLAKLKNLRILIIESASNRGITDTAICNLIENCRRFRSFTFNPCPPLTAKTINKFNQIAKNRPNINFIHTFKFKSRKDFIITTLKLRISYLKDLINFFSNYYFPPKNLEWKFVKVY